MIKVLGLGDNVVDKYIHLKTMFPGGNALNFSVYAKENGAESAYIGIFGDDEAAEHIIRVLKELKIDTSYCRKYHGENGYARVNIVDGDRVFLKGNGGGISKQKPIKLNQEDLKYINNFDLVHTSCYSFIEEELTKLKDLDVPISFDFSDKIEKDYLPKVCPYVDFSFMSCGNLTEGETKEKLKEVIDYGCSMALATRGIEGGILYDGIKFYHQPSKKIKAIDTLGAGDSFVTAFLLNLIKSEYKTNLNKEEVIEDSLKKGAEFAAESCLVQGAFGYGKKY
ncbi:fructoselysine 6-kinase [Clostridium sediminicola]|uniref:fructoselysine 6-kinase n=1 Tax=Clostridium sediminicola TaxID=3114879 RepID=UPI003D16C269